MKGYLERLHDFDRGDLTLTGNARSDKSCYWKLQFQSKINRGEIIAFLSPDQRFVFSDVIDLQTDPSLELRRRQQELNKELASSGLPSRGQSDAQITIVEFADFECPYCGQLSRFLENILVADKSVKLVFRNFPLPKHPWAMVAAEMSACAAAQDDASFWKLHDFFFSRQGDLNRGNIYDKATEFIQGETTLNIAQFKGCVNEHRTAAVVEKDIDLGRQSNVHATPTMFVNGVRYQGMRDAAQLQAILESARSGTVWPVPLAHTQVSSVPPVPSRPSQ